MLNNLAAHNGFIMRISLAFVFLWFGVSEIIDPINWVSYLPAFVSSLGIDSNFLVQIHGILLVIISFCLIFKLYLRYAAFLAVLIIMQITFGLLLISKFEINEIVVRDIGILGLAIGIWLQSFKPRK